MTGPQRSSAHENGRANDSSPILLCPNSAFPLTLSKELIPVLLDHVNEGIRALPRIRPEVGGLLLGPKSNAGQFLADETVPVSIEYLFGPYLRLSPVDMENLALAIGSAQENSSRVVVGFYRSRTRGDAKLRDSDREILSAIEQAHSSYAVDFRFFLVLTPSSSSAVSIGAVTRNGSGWDEMQHFTLRSNPLSVTAGAPEADLFEPRHMPAAAHHVELLAAKSFRPMQPEARKSAAPDAPMGTLRVPAAPISQPEITASSQFAKSSQPQSAPRQSPKQTLWRLSPIWLLFGAVAGVMGGYIYSTGRSHNLASQSATSSTAAVSQPAAPAPASSQSPLGLSAERRGADLVLSWDHEAPAVTNASFGMLLIRGAGVSRDIPLTAEQLRSGSVLYTPTADQVEIQLNVVSGNQAEHDSLIALLPGRGDAHPVVATAQTIAEPRHAPPTPASSAVSAVRTTYPATQPASNSAVESSAPAVPAAAPVASVEQSTASASPPPPASPLSRGPEPASGNETPPAVASASPAPTSGAAPPVNQATPITSPATAPAAAPPPALAPPGRAMSTGPVLQPTVQATPIDRVVPRFPDSLHSILIKPKTVQVRVSIDAAGKPVSAEVLPQPDSYKALDDAARVAVMQWKFHPATMGNRPVPSSLVLEFSFSPVR